MICFNIQQDIRIIWKRIKTDQRLICSHLALIIEGAGADINVDPVLHAACSLDLQKFCRDIPPGETSRQVVRNEKDPRSDRFFRGKKSGSDLDFF